MIWIASIVGLICVVIVYDLLQRRHAILRNFPIIGHLRYLLETVGPELRQYIVTSNDEERPFSRDQRSWVYASSKLENNYFGFGSDNDMVGVSNYLAIRHAAFPIHSPHEGEPGFDPSFRLPCAKVLGAARGRPGAFRPASVVNVSAMSFGSLSGNAIEALNRGSVLADCMHNTGEGGISAHHRHGADLIWQIGTGYFGARDAAGRFDIERCVETAESASVKAIEIKLSQGAKPGLGGVLPAPKVTAEIAAMRGIPVGETCNSPSAHSAFRNVDELLDFVEGLAERTGLPVGIKSAVGDMGFWVELAEAMTNSARGVDFITLDGGEGGTGAAPLVFSDHVAVPFTTAISRVYPIFAERRLHEDIVFIGSAKLGFPDAALFAFSLGCDMINVAREAMLSIGCIQAQRCHTGHCPAGVATQNRWLMRGLDPTFKAARLANYVRVLRKEILQLTHACGAEHPALIRADQLELLDGHCGGQLVQDVFGYEPGWELPSESDRNALAALQSTMREGLKESGGVLS
jgi:glutamate synthase domain-containing protein 2